MIRNCQVCHLDNPLGFRMDDTLMFRWTAEDLPGTRTDTARIVIYELSPSGEKIAVARDTGFTHLDSLTAEIRLPLKPETRYAWNVTVRTDTGAEEAGPEQYFETGRMDKTCGPRRDLAAFRIRVERPLAVPVRGEYEA